MIAFILCDAMITGRLAADEAEQLAPELRMAPEHAGVGVPCAAADVWNT
jgi:acetyl esterase/lipase